MKSPVAPVSTMASVDDSSMVSIVFKWIRSMMDFGPSNGVATTFLLEVGCGKKGFWPDGPGRPQFFRKASKEVQKSVEECGRHSEDRGRDGKNAEDTRKRRKPSGSTRQSKEWKGALRKSAGQKAQGADEAGRVGIGLDEKGKFVIPTN